MTLRRRRAPTLGARRAPRAFHSAARERSMSTVPAATPSAPAPPAPERNEVVVVSHSNLFYWWPVWACGFLMALITWIDGHLMYVVPKGTKASTEIEKAIVLERTKDGKEQKVVG